MSIMNDRRIMRSKPRVVRRLVECRSCEEDETDTSQSDHNNGSPPTIKHTRCGGGGYCSDSTTYTPHRLPPIGVFWDIENCQIPRGKSAVAVAQVIRDQFFHGYREAEFLVVCDVKKELPQVIEELNDAQVNLIHVGSQCKNAADEKLRQSIRRFADLHGSSAAIVLISGDINFAPDLCDLRHRKKIHVILVHNDSCSESLILCANEHYRFSTLVSGLPFRGAVKAIQQQAEVTVSALPAHSDPVRVRGRLKRLAENCGGRVGTVTGELATVRFPSFEFAIRAQKRMHGEEVFGSQITVSYPTLVNDHRPFNDLSPTKTFKKGTNIRRDEDRNCLPMANGDQRSLWTANFVVPTNPVNGLCNGRTKPPLAAPLYNQENIPNPVNSSWKTPQNKQFTTGRVILGRQNGFNLPCEPKPNQGYSSGRHSLDSMLDFEGGREENKRDKLSTATFENWLQNCNQVVRKCQTPSPTSVLGVNTSIPPPPIVNLPRRNDSKYFFHPIEASNGVVTHQLLSSPSPVSSNNDASEVSPCLLHSKPQSLDCSLVNVTTSLSDFSARLTALVTSHDNRLPLVSLKDCYEAQFEVLKSDGLSVPLEHLVTCVCSVELVNTSNGKYLKLATSASPALSGSQIGKSPLAQFGQEVHELLQAQPKCQVAFDRLIPTYRHMFGRQCRVSQYGCSKLLQLLDKLPHIVQVMGKGINRVVTLAHRAQMQRFTADLTRVLHSQTSKQVAMSDLSQHWIRTLGQKLEPTDYGLCYLQDLLDLLPTNRVVVNGETVSLARKQQQTSNEIQRTNQFTLQVVELLSTAPQFSIEFSKFIPAFYQHFRFHCRVADYGFTKLVELFEAIPHVVKIEGEMEGGRRVTLTLSQRLKVLSNQIASLVQPRYPPGLYLDALLSAYLWQFGNALRPAVFECNSLVDLINKLPSVKIATYPDGKAIVVPAEDRTHLENIEINQQKYCNELHSNGIKIKFDLTKTKSNGKNTASSALLDFLKKGQTGSTIENGVNCSELHNQLKPSGLPSVQEPGITLLSPADFLRPPSKSPSTQNLSAPQPPDPSVLPKPLALTLNQVSSGFDIGSQFLDEYDLNDQNKRKQCLKLAPQFCSPMQLK